MGEKILETLQKALDQINHLIRAGKVVIIDESQTGNSPNKGNDPKEMG